MGEQMVASLDNLANEEVQKNDKVEKLVIAKKTYLTPLQVSKHRT